MKDLNYIELIFSAFVGASIALILNSIYNYFKSKIELGRVESIIIADLNRKSHIFLCGWHFKLIEHTCQELKLEMNKSHKVKSKIETLLNQIK